MQNCFKHITINDLKAAFALALPGAEAHAVMLPGGRELLTSADVTKYYRSAVLMLLYPENDTLHFCLTKRNERLKHHPGQISFPGGRCENYETNAWETALRETEEEIGVVAKSIEYIGKLSDVYVTVSRFNIHPYVGFVSERPLFKVNDHEVDAVITLPLPELFGSENHTSHTFLTSMGEIAAPCYCIQDHYIWGATSMMLAELEALLRLHCSHRATRSDSAGSAQAL